MPTAPARRGLQLAVHRAALASPASAVPTAFQQWSTLTTVAAVNHSGHRNLNAIQNITMNANTNLNSGSPSIMALSSRRRIHSSQRRTNTLAEHPEALAPPTMEPARAPLSVLPLAMILRSLATTTVSSSPLLLKPSLRIMTALAHTKNPVLSPDSNPVLRYALKKTFYAQFCAGENGVEVRQTIGGLKKIGFTGVILGYAKEVVLSEKQARALAEGKIGEETDECIREEIEPWAQGTLETVRLAQTGDFVALK